MTNLERFKVMDIKWFEYFRGYFQDDLYSLVDTIKWFIAGGYLEAIEDKEFIEEFKNLLMTLDLEELQKEINKDLEF